MKKNRLPLFGSLAGYILVAAVLFFWLAWKTSTDLLPTPARLDPLDFELRRVQVTDYRGVPLSVTYANRWNVHDCIPILKIPDLLQQAFIESEDRRFYQHHGVDWWARGHAALQNLEEFRVVRGASTITEQVIRLIHPRPRTLWSRWLEGIEAVRLERRFSKAEILGFYLNQVPYAGQRRGVAQAARYYFDRDLDTLNLQETLALAVLVRAPTALDLRRIDPSALDPSIARLARRLLDQEAISEPEYQNALSSGLSLAMALPPVEASHFIRHIEQVGLADPQRYGGKLASTLDASLQEQIQRILDRRLDDLTAQDVRHGAVLVVDHQSDAVLAWVNGSRSSDGSNAGSWIDTVTTPRQPGSTLKPFLYALALEKGWTPATLIDDSPLAESIHSGLHQFHNYSRTHYGLLRLREALGNSLNVPAVRTIRFTGILPFLARLRDLGFGSLAMPADHYGEGLVLGSGEVSLFELVRAYTVLARGGLFRPLRLILDEPSSGTFSKRLFSEESATLITDILADSEARRLEFGEGQLLNLPMPTAVKTGTSTDHRDAWTVGFSHRYTVGVWIGNLDRKPMNGVTGTTGPALVLRAVFAELNRHEEAQPLYRSPHLASMVICQTSGLRATPDCPRLQEWFTRTTLPRGQCSLHATDRLSQSSHPEPPTPGANGALKLLQPTPGLHLVMDPRLPDEQEAFALMLPKEIGVQRVQWLMDGEVIGVTGIGTHRFLWTLSRGAHLAQARIWPSKAADPIETEPVSFVVK